MKVAKLEIKVIIAFMLAGFDFEVVDKFGKRPLELPKPDRNDIHQVRPLGEPCYLQFKRTVEWIGEGKGRGEGLDLIIYVEQRLLAFSVKHNIIRL